MLLQYEKCSKFFNSVIHFIAFYRFHFIWDGFKILLSTFFNQLLQGNDPLHEAGWLRDEPLLPGSVKQALRYLHRGSTRSLSRKSWSLFTGDMSMGNWESEGENRHKERKTTVDIWSSPFSSRFKMHKTDRNTEICGNHDVALVLHVMLTRRDRIFLNISAQACAGITFCSGYGPPLLHNTRLRPDRLNLTFHRIYEELLTSFFFFPFNMKSRSSSGCMGFNEALSVRQGWRQTLCRLWNTLLINPTC